MLNRFFDLPVPGATAPEPKAVVVTSEESSPPLPAFVTQGARPAPANVAPTFTEESSADMVRRARHLMKLHNYESVVELLEPLIEKDPDNAAYNNMLGISYMRMANDDANAKGKISAENKTWRIKGLDYLRRGSDLQEDRSRAAYDAGSYLYQEGHNEEAETYLRRALQGDPKDLFAWKVLTQALIKLERFDEAVVCLQMAYYCDPRDRQVLDMLKRAKITPAPRSDIDQKARTFGFTR